MRRRLLVLTILGGLIGSLLPVDAEAQRRRPRRPRAEVVAWAADASVVVFAEHRREGRRHRASLVARRVPSGDVLARVGVFPGPCAQVIEGRIAIAHACALAELRPRLPSRFRGVSYHIAATSRGRIQNITLRADGSVVEHELPRIGLVIRGRTEETERDQSFAVLELTRIDRRGEGRVLDRRPVRPRARRRWTLLQAGDDRFILVGRGVLRRISRRRRSRDANAPRSDTARVRPASG